MTIEISNQLSEVLSVIERHLESTLLAVHLYGSAVDGGLKPYSDIDLLVTVAVKLDETTRRALLNDLMEASAFPGESETLRAIEVTLVVHDDIIPWRYPAKRELQFGEWQRNDILAGIFEPAMIDIDLAILLTKAREHSVALVGPAAEEFFDPVPEQDLFEALRETLKLWNSQPDWAGDERNVVLTLSRIWYSAITGKIAPKDVAADWAIKRLPAQYQPVLLEAKQAYLGQKEDHLASRADHLEEFIRFVKGEIIKSVGKRCLTIRSSRPRYARRLNSGVRCTKHIIAHSQTIRSSLLLLFLSVHNKPYTNWEIYHERLAFSCYRNSWRSNRNIRIKI